MPRDAGTRLKKALLSPEVTYMPGAYSPVIATMLEQLGYEAMFMPGSQTNIYEFGMPDVGLMSMREMVDAARRITAVSSLPVFMDGDTGWGNVLNVYRSVQEAAWAGVAMMSIEDQEAPKKSGTSAGRRCVSLEEMIGKVKAAVDARNDAESDMLIAARTDIIGGEFGGKVGTLNEAIERCTAFVEDGGADVAWINTPQTFEDMHRACVEIPGPVIPLYGGPPPAPNLEEWAQIGAAGVLFPSMTTTVGLQATWDLLNDFKENGVQALRDAQQRARDSKWGAISPQSLLVPSAEQVLELEKKYLPSEQQRDYGSTWGHPTQI
jgi:2-methylisocitrate lyase-like PEP mutase family enzyme